ncbi:hypothetical protein [Salinicoccus halitifaciens]|uniref:Uncharacterized protein n=1 Tax=Salinicoccus halitifaciens TaxID=1073415 RepID=A0ABV2E5Q0_9STAP|nr:hypothetical protein [Salinicoccus halitifaciens]MCD2137170.1 hypothetical protein [Salinicoccus halitifaciens]
MTQEIYLEDMLEVLRANLAEKLTELVDEDRIYKFSVPDELSDAELSPCIRLNLADMRPNRWAGDKVVGYYYEFLIDIWHEDYHQAFVIGQHVQQVLREMNFRQTSPVFEEDEDTDLYRDSRTYAGNILI